MRRFLFVIIVHFLKETLAIQLMANIFLNQCYLNYLIDARPYTDHEINRLEIRNEFFILLISYFWFPMTDWVGDPVVKN